MTRKRKSVFVFSEHLRGEDRYDGVRVTPATGFEPSFATGVIEESLAIPAILGCHLRQEEPTRKPTFEQNPVPADDNSVEIDAPEGCEG